MAASQAAEGNNNETVWSALCGSDSSEQLAEESPLPTSPSLGAFAACACVSPRRALRLLPRTRRVTALYDYTERNADDELTFRRGDTFELLSTDARESGDEGWWIGRSGDRVGVFPSNFVAVRDDGESETELGAARDDEEEREASARRMSVIPEGLVEVACDELSFDDVIGLGGFGKVFRGTLAGQLVAIKCFAYANDDANEEATRRLLDSVRNEARLFWQARHPNVVELKAVCLEPPTFCLVMQYAYGGSLNALLAAAHRRIPFDVLFDWTTQIAAGMRYLHDDAPVPLVHRDLKSSNSKSSHTPHCTLTLLFQASLSSFFCFVSLYSPC